MKLKDEIIKLVKLSKEENWSDDKIELETLKIQINLTKDILKEFKDTFGSDLK